MVSIHCLHEGDYEEILSLFESRSALLKGPVTEIDREQFKQILPLYLKNERNRVIIGARNAQSEIMSIACLFPWIEFPYWTLLNLKSHAAFSSLGPMKNGIIQLYVALCRYAESEGLYKHYFVAPLRSRDEKFGFKAFTRMAPFLARYDWTTEAIFDPESESAFSGEMSILSHRKAFTKLHIRCGSLKQELRDPEKLKRSLNSQTNQKKSIHKFFQSQQLSACLSL